MEIYPSEGLLKAIICGRGGRNQKKRENVGCPKVAKLEPLMAGLEPFLAQELLVGASGMKNSVILPHPKTAEIHLSNLGMARAGTRQLSLSAPSHGKSRRLLSLRAFSLGKSSGYTYIYLHILTYTYIYLHIRT